MRNSIYAEILTNFQINFVITNNSYIFETL